MDSHPPPPPSTLARATLHHHRQQPPEPPPDPTTQRLSLPFPTRLLYAGIASSTVGLLLGTSQGGTTSALRFRAENSHRLPSSERGWYLYHKSKNYYVAVQSFKEGVGMAGRLTVWAAVFYAVEEVVDRGRVGRVYIEGRERFWRADTRRRKDVLSTTTAGCATAGVFSVWSEFDVWGNSVWRDVLMCACRSSTLDYGC